MYPTFTLLEGKESSVIFGHPWIFSGALEKSSTSVAHGSFVRVLNSGGESIATGSYSSHGSIAVRVFDRQPVVIDVSWLETRLRQSLARRMLMGFGPGTQTTGYRAVFGESDGIPGLVVDCYEQTVVFQIATAALDHLRDKLIQALVNVFSPKQLIERSDIASRSEEGLDEVVNVHFGEDPGTVSFLENGILLRAKPLTGQKTGFFLDQKNLRRWILEHHNIFDKAKVLNVFSYTGGAGIAAIKSGARKVLNVDSSQTALEGCVAHAQLNGIGTDVFEIRKADAFQFLSHAPERSCEVVIVDPPALIKSRHDTEEGKKAYHFLNRAAMRLVKDGGVLITSSCSHFLSEEDFIFLLRRGSIQSGCRLETLAVLGQGADHPTSIYFPESHYLKTFCFQVNR